MSNDQSSTKPISSEHACMGLNACAGLGGPMIDKPGLENKVPLGGNDCAGAGFCYTAAGHSCHTKNDCAGQGGCGLYGIEKDLGKPGQNTCRSMGSCAVPINSERFITDGNHRGESVWKRARKVFEEKRTAAGETTKPHPTSGVGGDGKTYDLTNGPSIAWITANGCMTACGSSGMSGGGSCS